MDHPFLTRQGFWLAEGSYFDESNQAYPLKGFSRVDLEADYTYVDGVLDVQFADRTVQFHSAYRLTPMPEGGNFTRFESENPQLGHFVGFLAVIDDTILIAATSESGEYMVSESLCLAEDGSYSSRGCLTRLGQHMSAWSARLVFGRELVEE